MKKLLALLCLAALLVVFPHTAKADTPLRICFSDGYAGDQIISFKPGNEPLLRNNRAYLPLRALVNVLDDANSTVLWQDGKATVTYNDATVVFIPNQPTYQKGNTKQTLLAPAFIREGRMYIPLRDLANALNVPISYQADAHLITIGMHGKDADRGKGLIPFAKNITPLLLDESKNQSTSPLSLYLALSMLTQGAEGQTEQDLLKALGTTDKNVLAQESKNLLNNLPPEDKDNNLMINNSLWVQKQFKPNPTFIDRLNTYYQAPCTPLDMQNAAELKQITNWIDKSTKGLIKPDFEPSEDILKLVNTLYFKGKWETPFIKELNQDMPFTKLDGKAKTLSFMQSQQLGNYYVTKHAKMATIPFENGCVMRFILPHESGLPALQQVLEDGSTYEKLPANASKPLINWQLPRFKFDNQLDCKPSLAQTGLQNLFNENCNLDGISKNLLVSSVLQLTSMTVDEKGCEAAAATIIGIRATSAPIEDRKDVQDMRLDRPFAFVLESKEGLPLFVGTVVEP